MRNSHPPKIESAGLSDIGLVRTNNEDVWAEMLREQFFILADGMGGHNAGEVAAHEAVINLCQTIEWFFASSLVKERAIEEIASYLKQSIIDTNAWVYNLSTQNKAFEGMGTTLCCCLFHQQTLICAHIGDSRIYRWRENQLERLTKDHSLKSELISKGELKEETAAHFPYKNIITRAVGTSSNVLPEIKTMDVLPNDIYLLCSDGLTDCVPDREINRVISAASTPKAACETLINLAKKRGGNDNITAIVVKVLNEFPAQIEDIPVPQE